MGWLALGVAFVALFGVIATFSTSRMFPSLAHLVDRGHHRQPVEIRPTFFRFADGRISLGGHERSVAGRLDRAALGCAGFGRVVGLSFMDERPHAISSSFHLLAFFCVGAAFVSADVSTFPQMAIFKALSLLLLFLYCASGARLAVLGREERFFRGVLLGSEIVVYGTAICYFLLGTVVWGNPNSLGAAMSIGIYPVLLWGWLVATPPA